MGIVDVWQSFNARKGEGGTDRYIRVACLSARERKLAAIPPYLPPLVPSFDPPLQIRHVWRVTFHRDVPPSPSIAQSRDMDHDDGLTADATDCLSILQKEKFCKIASETHRRRARVANYTSPVERGEYFWTRLLRDQLRVAKNASAAATRLNPFCNCLAPLKAAYSVSKC